jgi:hypothetical protein
VWLLVVLDIGMKIDDHWTLLGSNRAGIVGLVSVSHGKFDRKWGAIHGKILSDVVDCLIHNWLMLCVGSSS